MCIEEFLLTLLLQSLGDESVESPNYTVDQITRLQRIVKTSRFFSYWQRKKLLGHLAAGEIDTLRGARAMLKQCLVAA